jgi:hypothetical protein
MATIEIKKAEYKSDNNSIDVTSQLQTMVNNGQESILVNNNLAGDPDPGIIKCIQITYTYDNKEFNKIIQEGEYLTFKPFKGEKLGIFYTNNNINPKILEASIRSINKCNIDIISSSWLPITIGEFPDSELSMVQQLQSKYNQSSHTTICIQILQCLYAARNRKEVTYSYVSFLEHNVLYHNSHFQYPFGDIMFNDNYIGMCEIGYQLKKYYQYPLYQMTMKFENAITFFQNQLNASLQQDSIELVPPEKQHFNIYHSLIPNVHINNVNNLTSHHGTFDTQNIYPMDSYWGHYQRYYPEIK